MSSNKKAIFLTHPKSINFGSEISGGVQLCSREFHNLLQASGFDLQQVNVTYTKKIIPRLLIKLKLSIYCMFDVKKDIENICDIIEKKEIEYVFINMCSLLKYAKSIKLFFGNKVKILLLSHGNDSGDFLHLTTKPIDRYNLFTKTRDIIRLGFLIHIESFYRNNYLDGVLSVSKTEKEIENWFGAKKSIFIPRTIDRDKKLDLVTNYSRVGFIGRLDHPPNYQGITMVLDELNLQDTSNLDFRLIGAPNEWGEKIKERYPFVNYLGELSDKEVEQEITTWGLILNTVFWYSTGVTTKFAKCIEWGIATITTPQGTRGYHWKEGTLDYVNSPKEMAQKVHEMINNEEKIHNAQKELQKIKKSSLSLGELSATVKQKILHT